MASEDVERLTRTVSDSTIPRQDLKSTAIEISRGTSAKDIFDETAWADDAVVAAPNSGPGAKSMKTQSWSRKLFRPSAPKASEGESPPVVKLGERTGRDLGGKNGPMGNSTPRARSQRSAKT